MPARFAPSGAGSWRAAQPGVIGAGPSGGRRRRRSGARSGAGGAAAGLRVLPSEGEEEVPWWCTSCAETPRGRYLLW